MNANNKGRILLCEDRPGSFRGLPSILSGDGYSLISSWTAEHASKLVDNDDFDAVIADLESSNSGGIRLFDYIAAARPSVPVIFLTAYEAIEVALATMQRGAFYYFVKPPDYRQLRSIVARAVEQRKLKREIELLKGRLSEIMTGYQIIGSTPRMRKTLQIIEAVKDCASSVLITGERGTGKELIARTLHYRSSRSAEPFFPVNCAAISGRVMAAEFFGRVQDDSGSDVIRRRSRFHEAGNGVVFLEEVNQLDPGAQEMLLGALRAADRDAVCGYGRDEGCFRLISTANGDLREAVKKNGFCEELYMRMNEVEIAVPPLRERRDDIPFLALAFLDEFCLRQKRKISLSGEVMRAFQCHDWPGNVSQLRTVVERAVILARGRKITLRELPVEFAASKKQSPKAVPLRTLKELEMHAIREALQKCNGNKSRTARMLGISRKAFYKRLREAGQAFNS